MFSHLHFAPKWRPIWLACLLCLIMPPGMAQNASPEPDSKPGTTNGSSADTSLPTSNPAPTGGVRYCSIFTQYQRLNQQSITPWRESNEAVHQAGGWRVLAREANAPEPTNKKPNPNCPPGVAAAHGAQP